MNPSDPGKSPELSYLAYYLEQPSGGNELVKCAACPLYAASYEWYPPEGPFDPRANIFATQCYPWFGAIPSMTPKGMNMTIIQHTNPDVDGVLFPSVEYVVASIACPVNTFNRICAHTKAYYYSTGQKYNCTPCPPGYHTAGQVGQWYCQPPLGNIFTFEPLSTVPNVWGNRDLLNAAQGFLELECGYTPQHCLQCSENAMPPGSLPDDFNEAFVFSKILQTRGCNSGFYCPNAYSEIACPAQRPWSPPNSFSNANCSCAMGTYLAITMNRSLDVCICMFFVFVCFCVCM